MESDVLWLIILGLTLLAGIMTGIPVMLVIAGVPLAIAFIASIFGAFDLSFLLAYPNRIFGVMNNTILIAVPLFVLMGVLLEQSRVAERMLLNMTRMLGGSRGTLVLSVIVVSALIAASTGIIGATVVMLGMIALPALLHAGVSERLSSGLICASGTLGQIIPPSIVLIILGDQISNAHIEAQRNVGNFAPDPVTVGDLFAGALLPGLVLVALYSVYALAAVNLGAAPDSATENVTSDNGLNDITADGVNASADARDLIVTVAPPILLIIAVLGSILMGVATPTEAAAVGVLGTLLIAAGYSDVKFKLLPVIMFFTALAAFGLVVLKASGATHIDASGLSGSMGIGTLVAIFCALLLLAGMVTAIWCLWRVDVLVGAITRTIEISAMIFGIIIAASMLSLVFRGFQGDEIVNELLTSIPGEKWGMLIVTMTVIFLLGFVLEFVEIVLIVIPIIGPVLLATDFDPVWLAVLVALNLQTSFLTPPFGFALFYFRSVAPKEVSTETIYLSIIPFVIIQLLAMVIVVAFPALATWLPSLLFG
ncbi:MAG: TRAP transporter large permease subunit [Pseudomonadota bacterium]